MANREEGLRALVEKKSHEEREKSDGEEKGCVLCAVRAYLHQKPPSLSAFRAEKHCKGILKRTLIHDEDHASGESMPYQFCRRA